MLLGINLENIMLMKEYICKRVYTVWLHFCLMPRKDKFIKTESRLVVA